MARSVRHFARTLVAFGLFISAGLGVGAAGISEAAQSNQGLQGGWAVNDSGQIQFLHSLTSEYPFIQQAGASWVRINFRLGACFSDWATPTTTCPSAYAPTALAIYDTVVATALSDHLSILGLLSNESWQGTQTDWTDNNAENTPGGNGDNAYIQAFATSAAGLLAGHFAGKISQWEVWNEPNAWTANPSPGVYTGGSFIYPSNFAWLLKVSDAAIKRANASAVIISGGLFGTDPSGTPATVVQNGQLRQVVKHASSGPVAGTQTTSCTSTVPSGATYLCSTYQAGITYANWTAGQYPLDGVGQHLYIDNNMTTSSSKITTYLQDVRNAYLVYEGNVTAKKTQVTEVGWSTAFVTSHVQALNLQTAFRTFNSTSYDARSYWFNVQDIPEASLYYGLVTSNGRQKPSFTAYQKYATF